MIKEQNFKSIKDLMASLRDNTLLENVPIDRVVRRTISFIGRMGMPKFYLDKQETVVIDEWRGILPCDLISIVQVRDKANGICLRSMTDKFMPMDDFNKWKVQTHNELTFKTQGNIIYTSFKSGEVEIVYKAIPVDDDGFPMILDNPVFFDALEAFIKKEEYKLLFDKDDIKLPVLQQAQQEYGFLAKLCQSEFTTPSISEIESIKNMWCTLLPRMNDFYKGFKNTGKVEIIKIH